MSFVVRKLRIFCYIFLAGFTLAVLIHAQDQDQSGFISIDCGTPPGSKYTDEITGFEYISDENFVDSGNMESISPKFKINGLEQQFYNVRSFPDSEGVRNCYHLNVQGDSKYLIRARFMYGNYDYRNSVPQFDLYLGINLWDTITMDNASSIITTEIIHVPSKDYMFVCLFNTGNGAPFISSLELRLLNYSIYMTQDRSISLVLQARYDYGCTLDRPIRYKDDVFDRIWMPQNSPDLKILGTSFPGDDRNMDTSDYYPPMAVMRTAVQRNGVDNDNLTFSWNFSTDPNSQYYVFEYFSEVEPGLNNQIRELNIYENGKNVFGPFIPGSLDVIRPTMSASPLEGGRVEVKITKTGRSDLPPIINAIEIYRLKQFSQLQTHNNDVFAITSIKSTYRVKKNWQGDPCGPEGYRWDGIDCRVEDENSLRIVSLNMSSSGLTGDISPYFAELPLLEYLDLSDNNLSGTVLGLFSSLPSLRTLNLKRNKLTGPLPAELMEKSKRGSLTLSVDEINTAKNNSLSASSKRKKNGFVAPVLASVAALSVFLNVLAICWWLRTRKKKQVVKKVETELENKNDTSVPKHWQFTYSDVLKITKNFERVLGKGGFGTVYYGSLGDTEVAVKMLSSSSSQGYKEFHAEVKLLMRAHHKNLTTLIGYCVGDAIMGLIYEYMPNGTLEQHLSGKMQYILNWEDRMRIAVDAAQGLEYLHYYCKPPMVHRDVKPSNILLNKKLQAKIGDFGLSRAFPTESINSMSTDVVGTIGYVDPEYLVNSNRLNEKSDVYSFGTVLLNIITGQPGILKSFGNTHISEWIKSMLAEGDIRNIVDPRLGHNFNIKSIWKAVELALACTSHTSSERPSMVEVVMELKECLAIELAPTNQGPRGTIPMNSINRLD